MLTRTILVPWLAVTVAFSAGPVNPINQSRGGVALHGYDAVAYFTEGTPVKGSPQFVAEWMGAKWQFVSAGNRDRFQADPANYAPRYGGYCAYAVSRGYTADIDPEKWKVVDGKLYLNHPQAYALWLREIPESIVKADRNWPDIPKK